VHISVTDASHSLTVHGEHSGFVDYGCSKIKEASLLHSIGGWRSQISAAGMASSADQLADTKTGVAKPCLHRLEPALCMPYYQDRQDAS
jgi:hypothetical protein